MRQRTVGSTHDGESAKMQKSTVRITELPPNSQWIRDNLMGDGPKCFVVDIAESSSNDFVNIVLKTTPDANLRERDLVKDLDLAVAG